MLVYGDQQTSGATDRFLTELWRQANALGAAPRGILWHQVCVRLFLLAAGVLQGVADADFAAAGLDSTSRAQATLMTGLRAVAGAIDASWSSGFARQEAPDLPAWEELQDLPQTLTIRRCEGYAFYALYPEQYLAAARDLPRGASVIGLRSIGTGLAALVAAVCDAAFVCTLRPVGDVYARSVAVAPELEAQIRMHRNGVFALVDEGPGRSGSSLGGVADYLEGLGVARDRIVFLPSHSGDLGPEAKERHRARWRSARRLTLPFEALFLNDKGRSLPAWFEDATGTPVAPIRDLSGGRWRYLAPGPTPPADPGREARKYLLETASGTYLLKFAGLDDEAAEKLSRARQLHAAGFVPKPIALRHGFLAERWIASARAPTNAEIWPRIAPYLAFRAAHFPAPAAGAPLAELLAAARYNIGQAVGSAADRLFDAWTDARVAALQQCVRPCHVDGRMHRWEWIAGPAGALKTDAIDHAQAHDLVGCQDIAWDVAAAVVELGASAAQRDRLLQSVLRDRPEGHDLTALSTLCYLGFQIGWWDFAADAESAERQRHFYADRVAALIG